MNKTSLVKYIIDNYKIDRNLAEYVAENAVSSNKDIDIFFNGTSINLYDPYKLKGMKDAVERIQHAIDNEEKIVVYGDYDADGVCSASLLCDFLLEIGGDAQTYIPLREHGYGISEDAIDTIATEFTPDLIITVDCGISNYEEIEILNELCIDVIVTDHHSLPEELPQCIIINPKLQGQSYPFDDLCGAGVAFKLACAINKTVAMKYIDLVAIATIADSVKLVNENRLLVRLGLEQMRVAPQYYMRAIMDHFNLKNEINSEFISYYLAPLINAAGRLGSCAIAYDFLLSSNLDIAHERLSKLVENNNERKLLCENFTNKMLKKIQVTHKFDKKFIAISDESVPKGIIGIIASRLVEIYNKPVFVFTVDDEKMVGSLRSIEGIDLHKMLSSMSELFIKFGGHKMAAGLSIENDNFNDFVKSVENYLENAENDVFLCKTTVDIDITEKMLTPTYASGVEKLEPFGVGFLKPTFGMECTSSDFYSFSKSPKYMKVNINNDVQAVTFNGDKIVNILSGGEHKLLLDIGLNKNYLNVSIKDCIANFNPENISDDIVNAKMIEQLYFAHGKNNTIELPSFIDKLDSKLNGLYGTAIVINSKEGYNFYKENILNKLKNAKNILSKNFISANCGKSQNAVLFACGSTLNHSDYKNIFFIDTFINNGFINYLCENSPANIFTLNNTIKPSFKVNCDKAIFGNYFMMIKNCLAKNNMAIDLFRWYNVVKKTSNNIELQQFMASILMFVQLKFFEFNKVTGKLSLTNNKTDLSNSILYKNIKEFE